MSQYVRNIVVKRTFQGDGVALTLRPVSFVDALKFKSIDTANMKDDDIQKIFDSLKTYAVGLTGLRAEDASDVTLDEFFSQFYFSTLMIDMMTEWVAKGSPQNPSLPAA